MTVHKKAIIEILGSIRKLTTSKALVMSIFESSGIIIDDRLLLVSLTGNAEACLSSLMDKLSLMPSIKISAERIFRRLGLTAVMTERLSRQPLSSNSSMDFMAYPENGDDLPPFPSCDGTLIKP